MRFNAIAKDIDGSHKFDARLAFRNRHEALYAVGPHEVVRT